MKAVGEIEQLGMNMEHDFHKSHPQFADNMAGLQKWFTERYGPDAMEFITSERLQTVEIYKREMMQHSQELKNVMSDIFVIYAQFDHGNIHMGAGPTKDG